MSTSGCSQVVFFPFFLQENKGKGLTRGWTAFSALHIYRHSNNTSALALQSTNLCFCTMDGEAFRGKAKRQHMQVQAASSCLLIQSERPVFTSGSKCPSLLWLEGEKKQKQKTNKKTPPHFITRQASESKLTMKALSQLVNRLLSSGTESPTSVIDPIVYTTSHVCTCVIQAMFVRVRDIY